MHADGKSTLASVSKWNSRKVNWRTGWPIPAMYISFSSILNALSYVINLFSRCSFQLLSENSFEDVELPVRAENRRCIQSIKGELQCQNKLILFERPFKILQNETKIIKIGQAVLEIFKFKDRDLIPWIRGSKERSRSSQNSRPQDGRAKRAKGEEPLVTLDHDLVLEPVRLHVKLLCQDKRGAPIWLQKCLMRSEA